MTEDKMNNDDLEEISRGIAEFNLGVDCACEQDRACRVCGLTEDIKDALKTLRSKTRKEDAECFKDAFKINYCSLFHKCDWKCFHFDKDGIAKGELPSEHDAWRIAHGQYCKGKLCEAQAILKKDEEEFKK